MKFVKVFGNLFQPLKERSISNIKINVGDYVLVFNDDGTPCGSCGAVFVNKK